ncbi:TPA: hypothetical protein GND40_004852, partial [Salmonella enterica subsp. indica]|nr:hypothetical protein [Salmonella enterica subsp. indica]
MITESPLKPGLAGWGDYYGVNAVMLSKSSLRCGASVAPLLPCANAHKSPFLS